MAQSQTITKPVTATLDALPEAKRVLEVRKPPRGHWVGDGFPVRTIFGYDNAAATTPFLLMDYAGPYPFPAASKRRGVGEHAQSEDCGSRVAAHVGGGSLRRRPGGRRAGLKAAHSTTLEVEIRLRPSYGSSQKSGGAA